MARSLEDTRHIGVDTGVIDSDSKWRQAVGEVTPDYQDVLFKRVSAALSARRRRTSPRWI